MVLGLLAPKSYSPLTLSFLVRRWGSQGGCCGSVRGGRKRMERARVRLNDERVLFDLELTDT